MTTGKRNVVVKKISPASNPQQQRLFFDEVMTSMALRRPCLVLDCSPLKRLDAGAIHVMLLCLEEALRRNGDVRLAALAPPVEAAFEAARLGRLFTHYQTTAEAVASFHSGFVGSKTSTAAAASMQAAPAM